MSDLISQSTIQLTQVGLDDLNQELQDLVKNKLPKTIERVANAREQGDLSENADYQSARDEQEILQTRIAEIEAIIAKAKIVKSGKKNSTSVAMGSVVSLVGKSRKMTVTIVGEFEADSDNGKVSSVSPVGKAVMGKKKGDSVIVKAPAGEIAYEIKDIK